MRSELPVLFLMAAIATGQQPPTFRAGTELIQVNVVAEDKQGNPVTDLRREEFQIFDNGAPQEIRLFLTDLEKSNSTPPQPGAPNTFTNRIASPAGSHSGYGVIVIDTLYTALADEKQGGSGAIWATQKAVQAVRTIPPGDKIALYAIGYHLWAIREFTRDRESLEELLRTWKPTQDIIPPENKADVLRIEVNELAAHLAAIPGRKNLVWIGYPIPLSAASIQKLQNADIVLYKVDARGSVIGLKSEKSAISSVARASAGATGGISYSDRDDLDVVIREALADGRGYTLGFYPSVADRAAQMHKLEVRVSRPGVVLRYRTGYQTEAPQKVPANPKASLKFNQGADLVRALNQPIDATAIPIQATVARDPKLNLLNLKATLDVGSLDLTQIQDRWSGTIQAVARFTTADGKLTGEVVNQTLTLNLRQTTYDKAVSDGFLYHNELKVPAKAVELKLLFANLASGKLGTVTIPLSEIGAAK